MLGFRYLAGFTEQLGGECDFWRFLTGFLQTQPAYA